MQRIQSRSHLSESVGSRKLGVICSQFPEIHETFVARELQALRESGLPMRIYSMKSCRDKIVHDAAKELLDITTYVPWDHPKTWWDALLQCITHPTKSISTFVWTVRYHALPGLFLKGMITWMESLALARQMKRDDVAFVHAHWATMPTSAAVIVSKFLKCSFSFTAHAWDIFVRNPSLKGKIKRSVKVITCTAYNRDYLKQLCPEDAGKIVLNYHGVDCERFKPVANRRSKEMPMLLSIGRFVEQKGYADLIEAYKQLRGQGVQFQAVIVGDGPLKRKIEDQAAKAGLSESVQFVSTTTQDHIKELYEKASAFVLPCVVSSNGDRDGIPNVILEAMAQGLPIISTKVSGVPEAVLESINGKVVSPHNSEELAQMIHHVIKDQTRINRYGAQSRKLAEAKFDQQKHMRRLALEMKALLDANQSPMRVLYLIDKLVSGGTQKNLLDLVQRQNLSKVEPHVIALVAGGPLEESFRAAGVNPVVMDVKKAYGFSGLCAALRLKNYLKHKRIDLIQTHFLQADMIGSLAAKLAGNVRVVTTRRDQGFWQTRRQLLMTRFCSRFQTGLIANAHAVKKTVVQKEHIPEDKVHVIHNGIQTDIFYPDLETRRSVREKMNIRQDEIVVGVIANMRHAIKGHEVLIKAIPAMIHHQPNLKFWLIGEGPLREKYEEMVRQFGISEHVHFAGLQRNTADWLNAIDLFCLPSLTEGLSNAVLEAMAVGKPVVATDVGGNPELVTPGQTGVLVEAGSEEALARGILELAKSPELRNQYGIKGHEKIQKHFTIQGMIQKYNRYYAEILKRPYQEPEVSELDPKSRIKVMHVIWSLDLGGAEQVVMHIARGMSRQEFEPVVCCLNEKGRYAHLLENEGIKVVALHKKGKVDLIFMKRFVDLIKKEKANLIHTHLFTSNLWGRIAAKIAGVPVVHTEHNVDVWKGKMHLMLDRALMAFSQRSIFVSRKVKAFYQEKMPKINGKARVVYNGIDIQPFERTKDKHRLKKQLGIRESASVIGIVGRLVPQKAHRDFIKAIGNLKDLGQDVVGLIVGDGELRDELKSYVKELGLEKNIIFSGFCENMSDMYAVMDVFALSSYREGFPMTLLEAMASRVPAVVTDVGGVSECVDHEKNGLLIEPGNPDLLSDAILKILKDDHLRQKFQDEAQQKVKRLFTREVMVQNHENLYREVLEVV